MARSSRWNKEERAKLLKWVREGISEQDIRNRFETSEDGDVVRKMTAAEFAQQLKQAMVEAGEIKQSGEFGRSFDAQVYSVTPTGRLSVPDFSERTGITPGRSFILEKPRGRSKAWRLVPLD